VTSSEDHVASAAVAGAMAGGEGASTREAEAAADDEVATASAEA